MRPERRDQIPAVVGNGAECAVMDCTGRPSAKANDPVGVLRAICGYHYHRIISGRLHGWHPKLRRAPSR